MIDTTKGDHGRFLCVSLREYRLDRRARDAPYTKIRTGCTRFRPGDLP